MNMDRLKEDGGRIKNPFAEKLKSQKTIKTVLIRENKRRITAKKT